MYEDLKVLPGHTVKLDGIIHAISKESHSREIGNCDDFSIMHSVTNTHKKKEKKMQEGISYYSNMHKK